MGENSKIEWTDHTFNPWVGCTKVSPGCDHCYAEAWDRRFAVSGHAMRWGVGKKAAGRQLDGVQHDGMPRPNDEATEGGV